MPIYEYRCGNCGHQFEKFSTKMTDTSSLDCPKCDGLAERLISGGAGLLFKGSGFYTTDYRSKSYQEAASKEKGDKKAKPAAGDSSKPASETKAPKKDLK